jgi:hypothetical protein
MAISSMVRNAYNKTINLIKRCYISRVGSNQQRYQTTQVSYLNKTANIEVLYPYGLSGNPPRNSLGLMFNVQGQEENRAAIFNLPSKRVRNLKEGEVAISNYLTESRVVFKENGDIEVIGKNNQTINITSNSEITVGGDVTINVTGNVDLTSSLTTINNDVKVNGNVDISGSATIGSGSGAQSAVATVGDSVEVEVTGGSSAGTYSGSITSGSNNATTS